MNRLEALEKGEIYYNTGKPCRRGHHSDRFVSNGSCRECLRLQQSASMDAARIARGKRNLAMASGMRDHAHMHSPVHTDTFKQLCEILQYSPLTTIEQIKAQIAAAYDVCPSPRVLNRADLLTFMDYRPDGTVANYRSLRVTSPESRGDDDPLVYVYHNSIRYVASEAMEVLRGQRLNVRPK